jgi:hypothetical protein
MSSYTSTPTYTFMVWDFVKHRDNFTSAFTIHFNRWYNFYYLYLRGCKGKGKVVPVLNKASCNGVPEEI